MSTGVHEVRLECDVACDYASDKPHTHVVQLVSKRASDTYLVRWFTNDVCEREDAYCQSELTALSTLLKTGRDEVRLEGFEKRDPRRQG